MEALVQQAINSIQKLQSTVPCVIVGVDGPGGSGKSTIAKQIADAVNATLIHSDHFYKTVDKRDDTHASHQIVSDKFDWDLLQKKVFDVAIPGKKISYQPYSWEIEGLLPHIQYVVGNVLVVEGIYALQDRFLDNYHVKIWVEVPEEIRLERGVKRDGEKMRDAWQHIWIPQDKRYFDVHRPDKKADIIIKNN